LNIIWQCGQKAGILSEEASLDYLNRVYRAYQKNTLAITNYNPKHDEGD
jgi:hypothetical protein